MTTKLLIEMAERVPTRPRVHVAGRDAVGMSGTASGGGATVDSLPAAARRRSAAISAAEAYRSCGSRDIARNTMASSAAGTVALVPLARGVGSVRIAIVSFMA